MQLELKTQLKVSPQLVIASKLLECPGADVEQLVFDELAQNPALELASEQGPALPRQLPTSSHSVTQTITSWVHPARSTVPARGRETDDTVARIAAQPSIVDQLLAQAALMIDRDDLDVTTFLLLSLDEHGYLRASPAQLATELGVATMTVERVIQILHQLEPPGIGARDLRECLLIQCTHLESEGVDCAIVRRMLAEHWDDYVNQRWKRIARQLGVSSEIVDQARHFIYWRLYPYPLHLLEDSTPGNDSFRSADVIIHREVNGSGFHYTLEIPGADELDLRVSACFERVLQTNGEANLSPGEEAWINSRVEQARLFIAGLNQRWTTLRRIGECLIDCQTEFLEHGLLCLKPLTRVAIGRKLGLHESTVGRAIRGKVIQLPDGRLVSIADFFDDSLAPKEAIRQLLAQTDEPLSDREIADRLQANGLKLTRRTVAKYRQQMNIPSSHGRQHKQALRMAQ